MTAAHEKCFKALRSLRFNWIQDAEVALDKKTEDCWSRIRIIGNRSGIIYSFSQKVASRSGKKVLPAVSPCDTSPLQMAINGYVALDKM